jgi:hypothetical protein
MTITSAITAGVIASRKCIPRRAEEGIKVHERDEFSCTVQTSDALYGLSVYGIIAAGAIYTPVFTLILKYLKYNYFNKLWYLTLIILLTYLIFTVASDGSLIDTYDNQKPDRGIVPASIAYLVIFSLSILYFIIISSWIIHREKILDHLMRHRNNALKKFLKH